MTKNKLSEGVVGQKLIDYFVHIEGIEPPIDADALPGSDFGGGHVNYRLTFEDGSVSDWKVTFEAGIHSTNIIDAECFNQVI